MLTQKLRSLSGEAQNNWSLFDLASTVILGLATRLIEIALVIGLASILVPAAARAQTETVLHTFAGPSTGATGADGSTPYEGVIMDTSGNLFGTTNLGGDYGYGTVYELVDSSGSYTEEILHSFSNTGGDGANPNSTDLIIDSSGNLYGTTFNGGLNSAGTVFELVNSSGTYTEKILYSFTNANGDGANPDSRLVMDAAGNLYGTTPFGGANLSGTVYELANSAGTYTEKVLYSFTGVNGDGSAPYGGLTRDSAGNLYGTTHGGGANNEGIVFELVNSSGSFSETVLYSFTTAESEGLVPRRGLIMDSSGDLFGTSPFAGASTYGVVYELVYSPTTKTYTEKIIYAFTGANGDGVYPISELLMDASGNLYGTTEGGGSGGVGTVYELVNSSGSYSEKPLYGFTGILGDGSAPFSTLVMDSSGNLYGTTNTGGTDNVGIVFKVQPGPPAPEVSLSAGSLAFGPVDMGSSSAAKSVTVTNSGSANLTFAAGAVTVTGANATDFAITSDTCSGATIAPNKTCSVSIVFMPSTAAAESARLNFADNASNSPQTVSLSGTGILVAPTADLSASSLAFAAQAEGTTSTAQSLTLTNNGNAPLSIASITVTANFGESNTCGSSLAAGSSCAITVTFSPTTTGTLTGTLSVADNAANSPQSVSLSGTGVTQSAFVLYSFAGPTSGGAGADAANPLSGLVRDASGNLYGTTRNGGASGLGTVFEMVYASGTYTEKVLYSFSGADGSHPYSNLIMDGAGNLYGTTQFGGSGALGIVFELVNASRTYTEKVLYNFGSAPGDGSHPWSGLVMDASGNLFGTTEAGGTGGACSGGCGNVYELVNTSGTYSETILYQFSGTSGDGGNPYAPLIRDASGDLFGTTFSGGAAGNGIVFELIKSPNSSTYTEDVLYSFAGGTNDGANPYGSVIEDSAGNLYGTTLTGGASAFGTVYELVNSSGSYTEKLLYSFAATGADGQGPYGGLVMDSLGNLFGSTESGASGSGTVFELANFLGNYTETILHNFTGTGGDGSQPYYENLIMDPSGNLFGTTNGGGANGLGTVFEINVNTNVPGVTLSSTSLTFASQVVGTTSASQSVTVTNTGNANLTFGASAVTISGTNAADYSITSDTCSGTSITPTSTCSVSVVYTPSTAGSESAILNFADNAAGSPQTVSLSGTGTQPVVSFAPAGLTFTSQSVGTTSTVQPVTLTNTGNLALSITGITVTANFNETNNCGSSVAANGGTCTINVTFAPTANGSLTGTLSVSDNAANSPQTVSLSGTGTSAIFSAPAAGLSFGNQEVGTTSSAMTLTVTNTGNIALAISTVALGGTNAAEFTISSNTCASASLAPNATCAVGATFKPTASGNATATLTFTDNAANSPQAIPLSGNGTAPTASLSAASLNLGTIVIGQTSPAQTITLTNTGTATLNVASVTLAGTNASNFTITADTCAGKAVAPAAGCTTTVTFSPSVNGSASATLAFTDDSGAVAGSAQTVALTGTGTTVAVKVSPASLSFGGQVVGTASSAQTLTVSNIGTAPVTFTSVSVSANFAMASGTTCSAATPLAGGASCSIAVTFSPTASGNLSGAVTLDDNDPSSPQVIALSGTGQNFTLGSFVTSRTVTPGGGTSYLLKVSPQGGFSGAVNVACSGAPSNATCTASPASVTLTGSGYVEPELQISTTAPSLLTPYEPTPPSLPPATLWIMLAGLIALGAALRLQSKLGRIRLALLAPTALLLMSMAFCASCGGGGAVSHTPSGGTPAGTYTLTVSATSGTLSHSEKLTLIVQ